MRLVTLSLFVLLAACGAQEKDLPAADTSGVTDTGSDDTGSGSVAMNFW